MKVRTSLVALASVAVLASATLIGCTTEDTNPTTDTRSKVISNSGDVTASITGLNTNQLYAVSVSSGSYSTHIDGITAADASSLRVHWKRDANDTGADTIYYEAVSTASTAANTLTWATAIKTGPFTIYETNDNTQGHNSGLILDGANTRTVSISDANQNLNTDLILATDGTVKGSNMSLVSPDVFLNGSGIHQTAFADNAFYVEGGAANDFYTTSINNSFGSGANSYDIPDTTKSKSAMLSVMKKGDSHYARIEFTPITQTGVPDQHIFGDTGGTPSYRYVIVNVYYQPTASWGYVTRPVGFQRTYNANGTAVKVPVKGITIN